jgi:hypothetical protein
MRTILVLAVFCLGGVSAHASSPFAPEPPLPAPVQEILTALRSPDDQLVAWAAHHAGRLKVAQAGPPIARRLRLLAQLDGEARPKALVLTLLDALARMGATPPAETVMPFYDGWGSDHVLVILARHPLRYRKELLELFDRCSDGSFTRRVTGTVLASARTPGFAFHVLGAYRLAVHVRLRDSTAKLPRKPGSAYISGSLRDRKIEPPAGWPPAQNWSLGGWRRRGDEQVAGGPPTLYVSRSETEAWHYQYGWSPRDDVTQDRSFAWAQTLLRTADDVPQIWCRRHVGVYATGPHPYVKKVRRIRDDLLAPFWALVGLLLEDGVLTEEEALCLRPDCRIVVEDHRQGWSQTPLPEFPPPVNPWVRARRARPSPPGGI